MCKDDLNFITIDQRNVIVGNVSMGELTNGNFNLSIGDLSGRYFTRSE